MFLNGHVFTACPFCLGGSMSNKDIDRINEELLELADEIEELAEDEPALSKELNQVLELLVSASEKLEELES